MHAFSSTPQSSPNGSSDVSGEQPDAGVGCSSLDALPSLREATAARDVDVPAAATLAELAGVDAVRLGVNGDRKPVREEDLLDARRTARRLELRIRPSEVLMAVALEVRPDRVVLAADGQEGRAASLPLDLRGSSPGLSALVRTLEGRRHPRSRPWCSRTSTR